MSWTAVLFPDPLGPTNAVVSPALTSKFKLSKIYKIQRNMNIVIYTLAGNLQMLRKQCLKKAKNHGI